MKNKATLLTLLCFMSLNAEALELAFYTYGGFQETVSAFHRIALIFNDDSFTWIFHLFAVAGIFVGYAIYSGNQVLNAGDGQAKPSLRIILTVALGIAIYQGTIISKGEIWIIDEQNGREQKIDNVPDILVLAAGFTNKTERLVSKVLEDNPGTPTQGYSDGLNFRLLYDAVSNTSSFKQFYAVKSLQRFYQDCSLIPLNTNGNTFNIETIKSDTKDIFSYLGNLESTSIYTVHYTNTNKAGEAVSCRTAYQRLQGVFDNGSSYDDYLKTICKSNAFDVNDPIQLGRCTDAMTSSIQSIYGDDELDYMGLMKNYLVGMAITDALQQENPDNGTIALSNRAMVNEGVGTAVAAGKWLPTIRSVITAIILSLTPILLLFVVTGLAWKALKIVFALFAWVALWGVCDTLLQQSIIDQTQATFAEIVNHDMGLTAIMLTPGAAMKSLAILGEARGMGITIASFIAVSLFGLNAYAFSGIGQNFTNQINKHGENASNQASNTEQSGQLSEQIVNGNSYLASMSSVAGGYGTAMESATFNQAQSMLTGSMSSRALSGSPIESATRTARSNALTNTQSTRQGELLVEGLGGPNESIAVTADRMANVGAGSTVGNIQATEDATRFGNTSFDTARDTAHTDTSTRIGSAVGTQKAAEKLGTDVVDNAAFVQEQNSVTGYGDALINKGMRDEIISNNPSLSVAESSAAIAGIKNSEIHGKARATNGNPELYIDRSEEQAQYDLVKWEGFMSALKSGDTDIVHAAWATGSIDGYREQGNMTAYAFAGGDRIEQGATDLLLSQAFKGATAHQEVMQKRYGDYEGLYSDLAEHSFLMTNASMQNFMAHSKEADIAPNELALALTGRSDLSLTPEQAKHYHEAGLMSDEQYKTLEDGGAYSITQNLGSILSSSTQAGHNATKDDSIRVSDDQVVSSKTIQDYSSTIQTGIQLPHDQDVRGYLTEDRFRPTFENDVSKIISGDTNLRDSLVQRSADSLAPIIRSDRTKVEGVSADGSFGLSSPSGNILSGGGSIGISGRDIETDTYGSHRAIMDKGLGAIINESQSKADLMLQQGVDSETVEKLQAQFVAERYSDIYTDYLSYLKSEARGGLSNVDMDSQMKDIFDSYGIEYNSHNSWDNQSENEARLEAMEKIGRLRGGY